MTSLFRRGWCWCKAVFKCGLIAFSAEMAIAQGTSPTFQCKTVADLVATPIPTLNNRLSALVTGRSSTNDGGGGVFIYDESSSAATNLSTVFKPLLSSGRWIRSSGSISDILWSGTITNQKAGVNVPADSITNAFEVRGGNVPVGTYIVATTGTLTNSASDQYGHYFQATGSGGESGAQYAARFELNGGFTGDAANFVVRAVNNTENTGSNLDRGNYALDGVSHGGGAGNTSGYNVGTRGLARWASLNIGVSGIGTWNNGSQYKTNQTSVGVYGFGDSHADGTRIGGAFIIGAASDGFPSSAALTADSGGSTHNIFYGRNGGTNLFFMKTNALLGINIDPEHPLDVMKISSSGDSSYDTLLRLSKPSTHQPTFLVRIKDARVDIGAEYVIGGSGPNNSISFSTTPAGGALTEAVVIDNVQNLSLSQVGAGFKIKEGANARMGIAVLTGGSNNVANTTITVNTRIFLTSQVDGGTPGFLRVLTRTNATSFTIMSSEAADTSTVAWLLVEPSP